MPWRLQRTGTRGVRSDQGTGRVAGRNDGEHREDHDLCDRHDYRADLPPLREEFLGKKGPASTLVEISALAHPDWMIEIEAIAVL